MNKEETLLRKRLTELSRQAYHKDIVTFSDFLNLNELNILHTTPKDLFPARYETFGGYEMAERQMVAFLPDALYYEYQYPMQVLKIRPANPRFAEELSHRDYLGSLMNLGVERCKMGDILLLEDCAEVFVCQNIADVNSIRPDYKMTVLPQGCPMPSVASNLGNKSYPDDPAAVTNKGAVYQDSFKLPAGSVAPLVASSGGVRKVDLTVSVYKKGKGGNNPDKEKYRYITVSTSKGE